MSSAVTQTAFPCGSWSQLTHWMGTTSQGTPHHQVPPSFLSFLRDAAPHGNHSRSRVWPRGSGTPEPAAPQGGASITGRVKNSCASLSVGFTVGFDASVHHTPPSCAHAAPPRPCPRTCRCLEAKTVGSGGQRTDEASSASLAADPLRPLTSPTSPRLAIGYRTSEQEGHLDVVKSSPSSYEVREGGSGGLPVPGARDPSLTLFNHSHPMDEKPTKSKCTQEGHCWSEILLPQSSIPVPGTLCKVGKAFFVDHLNHLGRCRSLGSPLAWGFTPGPTAHELQDSGAGNDLCLSFLTCKTRLSLLMQMWETALSREGGGGQHSTWHRGSVPWHY